MQLLTSVGQYKSNLLDADSKYYGSYLPDCVVTAFIVAAASELSEIRNDRVQPNLIAPKLPLTSLALTWPEICQLVLEGFAAFDPSLAAAAHQVFQEPARFELYTVEPGSGHGRFRGDIAEDTRMPAPIVLHLDGTINDVANLAHEMGHLISSDAALRHAPAQGAIQKYHLGETQAYFTQLIAYRYLPMHGRAALADESHAHHDMERTRSISRLVLCTAADRLEKYGGAAMEECLASLVGARWRDQSEIVTASGMIAKDDHYRHTLLSEWHGHFTGLLLGSGLIDTVFDRAERRAVVVKRLLLDVTPETTILDVLDAAGIADEDELLRFVKAALRDTDPVRLGVQASRPARQQRLSKQGSIMEP